MTAFKRLQEGEFQNWQFVSALSSQITEDNINVPLFSLLLWGLGNPWQATFTQMREARGERTRPKWYTFPSKKSNIINDDSFSRTLMTSAPVTHFSRKAANQAHGPPSLIFSPGKSWVSSSCSGMLDVYDSRPTLCWAPGQLLLLLL